MLDPNTQIGAVTLNVADLSAQADYYQEVIGLHQLEIYNRGISLGVGDQVLVKLFELQGGIRVSHTTGLYHLALRVPDRISLGSWLAHYAGLHTPYWQGASDHGVSEALYLSDPEGNGIEIYADKPKTVWDFRDGGRIGMVTEPLDLQNLLAAGKETSWQGMPAGTDMGHIHLQVSDLDQTGKFYTALIGFDTKMSFYKSALFLAAGDYHHHIGLNTWQSLGARIPQDNALGLSGYDILLALPADLDRIRTRLEDAGYPFQVEGEHLSVADPSGNQIKLRVNRA